MYQDLGVIFCTLSLPEYGESLEEVIKSETDGDFAMALLAMLKADKNESHIVDMDLAKKDARVYHLSSSCS